MKIQALSVAAAFTLCAVGCGSASENDASVSADPQQESTAGNAGTFGGGSATPSLDRVPTLAGGTSSGGAGDVGGVRPGSACATSTKAVEAPPVHLVFMLDRSGSMGNSKQAGQNLEVRWKPVVAGLEAFFADAANANVSASLAFFSQGDTAAAECSADTYKQPAVTMRKLPAGAAFSTALDAMSPKGGTPTKPALEGAIAYAQAVKSTLPDGEKVAIVLATDGDPNDCSSTVENVAAAAGKVKSDIPTYVIGVGPDTTKLDTVAEGGGTKSAIMIATANPAQVSADLRAAVGQIKAAQLGCNYPLPTPPDGKSLDVNAVNVVYTAAGGKAQALGYSPDCANANGWHYDDAAAPEEVVMCTASCGTLKADTTGGKIEIVFGCATEATPGGGVR